MAGQRPDRARPRAGEVLHIPLDDNGLAAYAVILKSPKFAVFDGREVSNVEDALKWHRYFMFPSWIAPSIRMLAGGQDKP